jgi:FKBP-type peptidyl-prolyl cis-trans isomerase 2
MVRWTGYTADGKIFWTNIADVSADTRKPKVSGYEAPAGFAPDEIVAGGADQPLDLGMAILGMNLNETRKVKIGAEKAFGGHDPAKVMALPCEKRMSKTIRMQASQYVQATNRFPLVGKEVSLNPYFKARVTEVTEFQTTLEFLAKDEKVQENFGTTEIKLQGDEIILKLAPIVGSNFEAQNGQGVITKTDGVTFQVDFNHPLAGQDVLVEIEVVGITKAAAFKENLFWIEDYDKGLASSSSEKKPMFLLLYADWCGWSKKMVTESLQDPRIKAIKDRFVWVKVNSDKEKAFKEAYQQDGFPMAVVLNSKGDVVKKIDGFKDAAALKRELEEVL